MGTGQQALRGKMVGLVSIIASTSVLVAGVYAQASQYGQVIHCEDSAFTCILTGVFSAEVLDGAEVSA